MLQLVARLLDVAQDAGAKVGPQNNINPYYYYRWNMNSTTGLVRFVLEDFDKLQEEAYEKAIADARARAERLARLSKVELGPIVAVREIVVPGDRTRECRRRAAAQAAGDGEVPGDPGAGRAAGAFRGPSSQVRRQREEPMTHHARDRFRRPVAGSCAAAGQRGRALGAGRLDWRASAPARAAEKEVLPKHVTPETLRAVIKGLDYLAAQQAEDGSWITGGGQAYPVAMTGLAGTALPGPRRLADARQVLARPCRGPSSSWCAAPRPPG